MATNFPTSLDDGTSLPNPSPTDLVENATTAKDHDQQHSTANGAIKALEAEVGITGSAVTTSLRYLMNRVKETVTRNVASTRVYLLNYTTDDFIVGSDQKDDAGGTDRDRRLFFDKATGAFRAGYVTGTQWDAANLGAGSAVFGQDCKATGPNSIVAGLSNIASHSACAAFGNANTASGLYSTALGADGTASGSYSMTSGDLAVASRSGQRSHASGALNAAGDSQANRFVAMRQTSNATPVVLYFSAGTSATLTGGDANVLTIPVSKAHRFNINIVARRTDSTSDAGGWSIAGTIVRGASGNATFISTPSVVTDLTAGAISGSWAVAVTIDTANATNNYLVITVTGQTGATIRWVADINSVEVG